MVAGLAFTRIAATALVDHAVAVVVASGRPIVAGLLTGGGRVGLADHGATRLAQGAAGEADAEEGVALAVEDLAGDAGEEIRPLVDATVAVVVEAVADLGGDRTAAAAGVLNAVVDGAIAVVVEVVTDLGGGHRGLGAALQLPVTPADQRPLGPAHAELDHAGVTERGDVVDAAIAVVVGPHVGAGLGVGFTRRGRAGHVALGRALVGARPLADALTHRARVAEAEVLVGLAVAVVVDVVAGLDASATGLSIAHHGVSGIQAASGHPDRLAGPFARGARLAEAETLVDAAVAVVVGAVAHLGVHVGADVGRAGAPHRIDAGLRAIAAHPEEGSVAGALRTDVAGVGAAFINAAIAVVVGAVAHLGVAPGLVRDALQLRAHAPESAAGADAGTARIAAVTDLESLFVRVAIAVIVQPVAGLVFRGEDGTLAGVPVTVLADLGAASADADRIRTARLLGPVDTDVGVFAGPELTPLTVGAEVRVGPAVVEAAGAVLGGAVTADVGVFAGVEVRPLPGAAAPLLLAAVVEAADLLLARAVDADVGVFADAEVTPVAVFAETGLLPVGVQPAAAHVELAVLALGVLRALGPLTPLAGSTGPLAHAITTAHLLLGRTVGANVVVLANAEVGGPLTQGAGAGLRARAVEAAGLGLGGVVDADVGVGAGLERAPHLSLAGLDLLPSAVEAAGLSPHLPVGADGLVAASGWRGSVSADRAVAVRRALEGPLGQAVALAQVAGQVDEREGLVGLPVAVVVLAVAGLGGGDAGGAHVGLPTSPARRVGRGHSIGGLGVRTSVGCGVAEVAPVSATAFAALAAGSTDATVAVGRRVGGLSIRLAGVTAVFTPRGEFGQAPAGAQTDEENQERSHNASPLSSVVLVVWVYFRLARRPRKSQFLASFGPSYLGCKEQPFISYFALFVNLCLHTSFFA